MESLITSIDALPPALAALVSNDEKAYIEKLRRRCQLPFAVTPHFAALARPERDDPIRRQFFPDPREEASDPFALEDPLGAARHCAVLSNGSVIPRLIHQYRDRALLLAGGACYGYCRHCFRRVWLAGAPPFIQPKELEAALAYLAARPEIREILISGGDPLTARNETLEALFSSLRQARPGILLRICTRAPVTNPLRLCGETIALFQKFRPLRLSVHVNHPRELEALSPQVSAGERLAACVEAGIPVHIQTVLLRGVNDNAALLAELFRSCLDRGLSPYYLFQLDLAPGTAHFRVPLEEGLAIYKELGQLISGLGLPAYAVDLPGGGGKIRLHDGVIAAEKMTAAGKVYLLRTSTERALASEGSPLHDANGKFWEYPA
jgi:lysine 2,3-aminomutase